MLSVDDRVQIAFFVALEHVFELQRFQLGRLTGRLDVEDVLDVIFRDFCIGK